MFVAGLGESHRHCIYLVRRKNKGERTLIRYLCLNNQPIIAQTPNIVIKDECRDREFINNLGVDELNGFAALLVGKIESLNQRINTLRGATSGDFNDTKLNLTDAELNLDDLDFTFDALDGFGVDDLGFGKSTSDQMMPVQPPSALVIGDLDFNFDGLHGFGVEYLGFGMSSPNDEGVQALLPSPSVSQDVGITFGNLEGFGFGMMSTDDNQLQVEPASESTSVYNSLTELEFVDDEFDWMKEVNNTLSAS